MPTVNIHKSLFEERMGKQYTEEELEKLCFEFGIEVEFDTELDGKEEIKINSFEVASNRIDLLCVEGIVRSLKIFLEESQPEIYIIQQAKEKIIVKSATKEIRPFVVGAVLRNVNMTQAVYDSFIDLQDKLHMNICRRRKLVSVGTHDLDTVQGPFIYTALKPSEILFTPLGKTSDISGEQFMDVYSQDNKLKAFLPYIRNSPVYPVVQDKDGRIMSLPPIINSEFSKITLKTKNIFIEATANDLHKAHQVLNQLVANFSVHCDTSFSYEQVEVEYEEDSKQNEVTPELKTREFTCNIEYMCKLAGVELEGKRVCELLNRMGLRAEQSDCAKEVKVSVDCNRSDIMHPCDVAEDLAIAYNYNSIEEVDTPSPTIGSQQLINKVSDLLRQEMAFAGYKESLNFALCSKEEISLKINQRIEDSNCITIGNPKTMDFQTARTTLMPGLMKSMVGNKQNKLPLDLFELSDVVLKDPTQEQGAKNQRRLCALHTEQNSSGFELIHGLLDYVMIKLNIPKCSQKGYSITQSNNPTFFPGRQATIFYKQQAIGFLGIIHPIVLKNFEWPYPVSLMEIEVEPLIQHLVQ